MESSRTIDLEALLAPISEKKPAGESLRYTGTYDAIVEARRAEDSRNQGEWKRDAKVAEWPAVTKIATEALAFQTKDIQIAAWLTEGLVKQSGFTGLRDGLELLGELHKHFWETLFPEPQDGEMEVRASVIEWLNVKLPIAISEIALTQPTDNGVTYSLLRYQESRAVEELGRKNREAMQAAVAEGKIAAEQFEKAVAAGSRIFYESLFDDIGQALQRCGKLAGVVDEKFGRNAPSLLGIKKALEDCSDLVGSILKTKHQLEPKQPEAEANGNVMDPRREPEGGGDESMLRSAQIVVSAESPPIRRNGTAIVSAATDRTEALRQLQAIAEYFHRTEPHSPVAYLVQRAVRWGEMPLEKWLTDVISDEGVLTRIRETLGIKGSGEGGA
jgi:type VI secretion system protein ImpA